MIYLDNGATTFPKPPQVIEGVTQWLNHGAGTPGRGTHASAQQAANLVNQTRQRLARFFGVPDEYRIVFSYSATDALNLALKGYLNPGDHVLISAMEHNSVLRPLRGMEQQGIISLEIVPCDEKGYLDPDELFRRFTPKTRLVVVSHASNVTGAVQPIATIGRGVRERNAYLLVDAAQTTGVLPTRLPDLFADMLVFAGHKGLFGLQGTGGLVIGERIFGLRPWREGGTGFNSLSETQPVNWPEAFEAGTPNLPGILSLGEGLAFVEATGLTEIHNREMALLSQLWERLSLFKEVDLYGPPPHEPRVAVLSFNLRGWDPEDVGQILCHNYGIQVRTGLHCSPLAHQTIGTHPTGTVRVSPGIFNSPEDIKQFLAAIKNLAATQIQW